MAEELTDARLSVPEPSIGRVVWYRSRTGNYTLPALITATVDTLWDEGVERGDVPALTSRHHVHLTAFTPGDAGTYQEHDVPLWTPGPLPVFEPGQAHGPREADGQPPETWRWPLVGIPGAVLR